MGVLSDERLKRPADAEAAWQRVLSRDERHEDALRALDRLYRTASRFSDLRALDPAEDMDLLLRVRNAVREEAQR